MHLLMYWASDLSMDTIVEQLAFSALLTIIFIGVLHLQTQLSTFFHHTLSQCLTYPHFSPFTKTVRVGISVFSIIPKGFVCLLSMQPCPMQ